MIMLEGGKPETEATSPSQDLTNLFEIGAGILAHADVVGMDALDHGILCETQFFVSQEKEILDALLSEGFVGSLLLLVGMSVPVHRLLGTAAVGVVVLYQQDGSCALLAKNGDAFEQAVVDEFRAFGGHIWQTVDDEKSGWNLCQETEHLFLDQGVAREAQIDDWMARLTVQDIRPGHTRS